MRDYSYQEMLKMQEEAAIRVKEMKRRASIVSENENQPENKLPDAVKHISYPVSFDTEEEKKCDEQCKTEVSPMGKGGLLDIIKGDSDSFLVLFILLLISQEETDYLTSLALLYLLI